MAQNPHKKFPAPLSSWSQKRNNWAKCAALFVGGVCVAAVAAVQAVQINSYSDGETKRDDLRHSTQVDCTKGGFCEPEPTQVSVPQPQRVEAAPQLARPPARNGGSGGVGASRFRNGSNGFRTGGNGRSGLICTYQVCRPEGWVTRCKSQRFTLRGYVTCPAARPAGAVPLG
jgi:hypothetical protein